MAENSMYHTHISAKHRWLDLNLKEVWQYRDLIYLFTKRNFVVSYKQTILGPAWIFLTPLFTSIVQAFVFGGIAGIGTDGIPTFLFYLCSNAVWAYFANCLTSNANTFTANAYMFGKVYFPRLTTPISNVISTVIRFGIQMALVLVFGSKYLGFPTLYSTRNVGPSSVLPIVCLSLASIAGYALWTRRYMVDELTRDYIKLARVKGLSSREIMFKHVLRNAMVPMVQYIPQSILLTVGGSLLMERFFSVPGMGPLLTDAIQRYDLNVVQTLVIFYAVLDIAGVFLGDVLMMVVDPRITLTGKEEAR